MNDGDIEQRVRRALLAHRDATEARRVGGLVTAAPPSLAEPADDRRRGLPTRRPRRRLALAAAAVAAALLAGLIALDRAGRVGQPIDTADTTAPVTAAPEPTSTMVAADTDLPTTSVVSPGPDRSEALWFRNHFEGLADDRGTVYRQRNTLEYIGPMVRTSDGTIYFVQDGRLFLLGPGRVEPEPVPVDGPVDHRLELDGDGEVVWLDRQNTFRRLDGSPAPTNPAWSAPAVGGPAGDRKAANGWTARALRAEVVTDPSTGMTEEVTEPAELQILDPTGAVARTFTVGGVSAADVALEDFDGRRAIVSRIPSEPAGSPSQMLVIDLACDPVCVRTSIGVGDTVLNGPDVNGSPPLAPLPGGSASSAAFPLGLCPTEGMEAPDPPAELSRLARRTFRALALGLATCDPFTFQGAAADARVEWSVLEAALSSPPIETSTDDGQTAWNFTDPASERWLSIDASGQWTVYEPTG